MGESCKIVADEDKEVLATCVMGQVMLGKMLTWYFLFYEHLVIVPLLAVCVSTEL